MARTVATTVIAAFNAQTTTQAFYSLLTVTHPSWGTPVRLVNNTEDIVSNGNTFSAFPFSVVLLADDDGSAPRLRVSIANTTRIIVSEMRAVAGSRTRITATLSVVSSIDNNTAIADFPDFDLVNVSYNSEVMSFDLVVDPFMTEAFPALSFAPSLTPGIF